MTNRQKLLDSYRELRADYTAATDSRLTRSLTGYAPMGSGADYHQRNDFQWLKRLEAAREVDRNDVVVGQAIRRLVSNVVQQGVALNPTTGDPELDRALMAKWNEYCQSPDECDAARQDTFLTMAKQALRAVLVDGDIFAILTREGQVQLVEAHRVRSPKANDGNTFLGVTMNANREQIAINVVKDTIDPNAYSYEYETVRVPVRTSDGVRQVLHVVDRRRTAQTRGVTVLAPILNTVTQHNDLQFAQLVKAQVASAFGVLRTFEPGVAVPGTETVMGETESQTYTSHTGTNEITEIGPGMEYTGAPGEKLDFFTPNVPNAEFFDHSRLILTFIAVNLDIPVHVLLLDPSDTNFSGWRGAIDQARRSWQDMQQLLIDKLYRPVYLWKLSQWRAEDRALRAVKPMALVAHEWNPPYWPYIEPLKDAQGDAQIITNHLNSRRKVLARRGLDIDEVDREIVSDQKQLFRLAIEAADELNAQFNTAQVNWRELVSGVSAPSFVNQAYDDGESLSEM